MMTKVSLGLNVMLVIAVAILYFLHFSSSEGSEGASESKQLTFGNLDNAIAYINSDSLLKNYDYFKEAVDKLEQKRQKLEAEFQNRAQGLQNEVSSYQRTASNMTMGQARAVEEDLMKKQQNLRQYQENLTQQLMQEETVLNEELYNRVSAYLKDFGNRNQLKLVLTYTKGSGVLFANDSLDITEQVIQGLNEEYSSENASGSNKSIQPEKSDSTSVQ
jgi:outer membrane protein